MYNPVTTIFPKTKEVTPPNVKRPLFQASEQITETDLKKKRFTNAMKSITRTMSSP